MLKQLSVFVENEIGSLSKVTGVLKEFGINLRAISSYDTPEFGIMRMLVDQPDLAKQMLLERGFIVKITEVLAVEMEDKPGNLDAVLGIFAKENLQVNYIYSFVIQEEGAPLMVISVEEPERAVALLVENGVGLGRE